MHNLCAKLNYFDGQLDPKTKEKDFEKWKVRYRPKLPFHLIFSSHSHLRSLVRKSTPPHDVIQVNSNPYRASDRNITGKIEEQWDGATCWADSLTHIYHTLMSGRQRMDDPVLRPFQVKLAIGSLVPQHKTVIL